jgi:hypothetical protein
MTLQAWSKNPHVYMSVGKGRPTDVARGKTVATDVGRATLLIEVAQRDPRLDHYKDIERYLQGMAFHILRNDGTDALPSVADLQGKVTTV